MNNIEYILSKIFLNIFYYIFFLIPVNSKKITFSTPRNTVLDGNMKYIYRQLKKDRSDLKFVFLFEKYSYSFVGKIGYLLRLVKGTYHLATSRVFIVDNAYFPVHVIKHKKKTKVIQVWHAAGAYKKFGNDIEKETLTTEDKFIHKNYDYCIVPGDFAVKYYASAFGMKEEQVLPLGSARTDLFFDESILSRVKKEFYDKFPQLKDKKIILYAPTFRGRGADSTSILKLDVDKMRKAFADKGYVLLYKPHLNVKSLENEKEDDKFFIHLEKEDILNKMLPVCDILITDYSSVVFEYGLLKKPMILYVYDLEEYSKFPGFYMDIEKEMIGSVAKKTDDVIRIIEENDFDLDYYDEFLDIHFKDLDGKSTKRIEQFILDFVDNKK